MENKKVNFDKLKFYLPPSISENVPYLRDMLYKYLEWEFPPKSKTVVYHVPKKFSGTGQLQGCQAEELIFRRLQGLATLAVSDVWILFFHSATYGAYSNRSDRFGTLTIREHDFVVFIRHRDRTFVLLLEVKSTRDKNTVKDFVEFETTADGTIVKNNKRSAVHQLRDHVDMLENLLNCSDLKELIQCYILWPFLSKYTTDPKQKVIKRWKEDGNLHLFEDAISEQERFNAWLMEVVLSGNTCPKETFDQLLTRYIVLSSGVFMDEIDKDLLALLTQQQLRLLSSGVCKKDGPLVVHGIAGTGKTLLVLKKLQALHDTGQLDRKQRALYVCYWPGIRCEVVKKLKLMGIGDYVDTVRFYISMPDFLSTSEGKKYKHVFMDEAEALVLSFTADIAANTLYRLYKVYHDGNCAHDRCPLGDNAAFRAHAISRLVRYHADDKIEWGEFWFLIDTEQVFMFLPEHSPRFLQTPHVVLDQLLRSTLPISRFFSSVVGRKEATRRFYDGTQPLSPSPPILWADRDRRDVALTVACVVLDLTAAKGVRARDVAVIPFVQNERLSVAAIDRQVERRFAAKTTYRPKAIGDVERFLLERISNEFLVAWALRVKGLEFKVVVLPIDEEQFEGDAEDRRRIYVIASRCTSLLIVIGDANQRRALGLVEESEDYRFDLVSESVY